MIAVLLAAESGAPTPTREAPTAEPLPTAQATEPATAVPAVASPTQTLDDVLTTIEHSGKPLKPYLSNMVATSGA